MYASILVGKHNQSTVFFSKNAPVIKINVRSFITLQS